MLADDLFRAFSIDLVELQKDLPHLRRKAAFPKAAAAALAAAAPSPEALMTEVVRCGGRADSDRDALGVAMKYRDALHPNATWVCNHCDFRSGDADPATNYGDVWSRAHLAATFRPGSIPAAFAESLDAEHREFPPCSHDCHLHTRVRKRENRCSELEPPGGCANGRCDRHF